MANLFPWRVKLREVSSPQWLHSWHGIWRAGGWYFPESKGKKTAGQQEDTGIRTWKVIQTLPCVSYHIFSLHISVSFLFLCSPDSLIPRAEVMIVPVSWGCAIFLPALIPDRQGCNFDWPSLSQLSDTLQLEVRGMFNQMVLRAISSEFAQLRRLLWAKQILQNVSTIGTYA